MIKRILSKRERVILYATISVVIFSIAFNLFIAPVLRKNESLNKEIKITRTKLRKYLRLINQKQAILEKYNKFSSNLKLSEQQQDTVVSTLSELEKLANNTNIKIIEIRPQTPKISGSYKEIAIDLRAEGDMEGYLKFIYDIEHSLLSMTIKKLQLNSKPNSQALEGIFSISQISASQ